MHTFPAMNQETQTFNPWNFPVDPEPLSAEDRQAIHDGEEDARHGRCISTAELCRKHGIDLGADDSNR